MIRLKTEAAPEPTFSIEQERVHDASAREALLDRAMGPGRKRKSSEKLRRGRLPAAGLAFVARDPSGNMAGSVRLWNIRAGIDACGQPVAALLLGPLAVSPEMKGAGLGSALVRHAIAEATRLEHRAVLLVGDAPYYQRFGFCAQKTGCLSMPGPYEKARLLALELVPDAMSGASGKITASGREVGVLRIRAAA